MAEVTGGHVRRTATVTVLFCDLVGSTDRQSGVGDDAADAFRRDFFAALRDAVVATSGETVKNTGDGVMVVFRASAADAVACASRMHENVEALDTADRAFVRVGISAGESASEDGDWFGTPVVEAARLCDAAASGQTLVTHVVRGLVGTRGGHDFRAEAPRRLKGLTDPVAVYSVVRSDPTAPPVGVPLAARSTPRRSTRRTRMLIAGVAVVVALAVAFAFVGAGDDSSPKRPTVAPATYPVTLTAATCPPDFLRTVSGATCKELTVPEDRHRARAVGCTYSSPAPRRDPEPVRRSRRSRSIRAASSRMGFVLRSATTATCTNSRRVCPRAPIAR